MSQRSKAISVTPMEFQAMFDVSVPRRAGKPFHITAYSAVATRLTESRSYAESLPVFYF